MRNSALNFTQVGEIVFSVFIYGYYQINLSDNNHKWMVIIIHSSWLCVSGGVWKPLDPVTSADNSKG